MGKQIFSRAQRKRTARLKRRFMNAKHHRQNRDDAKRGEYLERLIDIKEMAPWRKPLEYEQLREEYEQLRRRGKKKSFAH